MMRSTIMMALAGTLLAAGCSEDPCAPASTIAPGAGVDLGGTTLCLGQTAAALEASLGPGQGPQDLGAIGYRRSYPARHLALLFTGPEQSATLKAIILDPGAQVKTAGGVGIGSTEAEARAALGDPVVDHFVKAWWYPKAGITLQWTAGKVSRIQIASAETS